MKLIKRVALILAGLLALVYLGDYAAVRLPIPRGRNVFGTVTVRPYYAVTLKNGKSDFYFLDSQKRTCVNSLFPHMGYAPCWYLENHKRQRIQM